MSAANVTHGAAAAAEAADVIRERMGVNAPACAIILGSGLGSLADRIENARRLPYAEIPGFHATHVAGHYGQLIAGRLAGREVIALAGRFHMYEGHSPRVSAFPVRVVHALRAGALFVDFRQVPAPNGLLFERFLPLSSPAAQYRMPLFFPSERTSPSPVSRSNARLIRRLSISGPIR